MGAGFWLRTTEAARKLTSHFCRVVSSQLVERSRSWKVTALAVVQRILVPGLLQLLLTLWQMI